MPGTMDLIRQIKKNKRLSQVPIVALTASDNPKDLIQAFDYGIYDCIQKPIYEEVVFQRVKNAASNYLRLKELKKLRESLMNNQQIDDLTGCEPAVVLCCGFNECFIFLIKSLILIKFLI